MASDSALEQLRHGGRKDAVLVGSTWRATRQVGLPGSAASSTLSRAGVGQMTMPPFTERPEDSRGWFAALAQLAGERGLRELSMGTSQDYAVAAQEGATIVRLGTSLYT